jgi:hypothetical protein
MLDRMKDLGSQLTTLAGGAVDGVRSTMREGAESIADAAGTAASNLNDKAVRAAVEQMRTILRIAAEEVAAKPVSERPVTLTASVNLGFTALEMQIVMPGSGVLASDETGGALDHLGTAGDATD